MDPSKLPRAKPHLPVGVVAPTVRKDPNSTETNARVTSNTPENISSQLAEGQQDHQSDQQQELQNVSSSTGQNRPGTSETR